MAGFGVSKMLCKDTNKNAAVEKNFTLSCNYGRKAWKNSFCQLAKITYLCIQKSNDMVKQTTIRQSFIFSILALVWVFAGCGGKSPSAGADSMVQDMDEVEREALAYYDKAQEYDMNWQMRLGRNVLSQGLRDAERLAPIINMYMTHCASAPTPRPPNSAGRQNNGLCLNKP